MKKGDASYIRKMANKLKSIRFLGGACENCGGTEIYFLEFHHKIDKIGNVSGMLEGRWEKIKTEITKCNLLCRNCHRELRWGNSRCSVLKIKLLEIKKSNKCLKCGYAGKDENFASLDFHHRLAEDKDFSLGNAYKLITKYRDKVIRELEKCDVLCSNCHAKEHFNNDRFEKFKDLIYDKISNNVDYNLVNEEAVIKLVNDGMLNYEICKKLNIPPSTLSTVLNRLGIKRNKKDVLIKRMTEEEKIEIYNQFIKDHPNTRSARFAKQKHQRILKARNAKKK